MDRPRSTFPSRAILILSAVAFFSTGSYTFAAPPESGCEPPPPGPSCEAPLCPTLLPGPTVPWQPDRRPGVFIGTWNGSSENTIGLAPWWYDDDVEEPWGPPAPGADPNVPQVFETIGNRLEALYQAGFRRITLRLPAGSTQCDGSGLMGSAQFWTMPPWRRAGFTAVVAPWIESKAEIFDPVSLGVYGGFEVFDPCSLSMDLAADPRVGPSPSEQALTCAAFNNIRPWAELGFAEYWLDAAKGAPETVAALQALPGLAGEIRLGGEAIPVEDPTLPGCLKEPNRQAFEQAPWMGWFVFVETRFPSPSASPPFSLTEPPPIGLAVLPGEELGLVLDDTTTSKCEFNPPRYTLDDAYRYHRNGWTLWAGGSNDATPPGASYGPRKIHVETIQRVLSFGVLTAGADFNNDGHVDAADLSRFEAFFAAYRGQPGAIGYYHGDLNRDHEVSCEDYELFACLYGAAQGPNPQFLPLNLDHPASTPCTSTLPIACPDPG